MTPHCTSLFPIWVPDITLYYIIYPLKCFSVLLNNLLILSPHVQILCRLTASSSINTTGRAQTQMSCLLDLYCVSSYSTITVSYFTHMFHYLECTINSLNKGDTLEQLNRSDYQQNHFPPHIICVGFSRTKVNYKLLTGWSWLTRNLTWSRGLWPNTEILPRLGVLMPNLSLQDA